MPLAGRTVASCSRLANRGDNTRGESSRRWDNLGSFPKAFRKFRWRLDGWTRYRKRGCLFHSRNSSLSARRFRLKIAAISVTHACENFEHFNTKNAFATSSTNGEISGETSTQQVNILKKTVPRTSSEKQVRPGKASEHRCVIHLNQVALNNNGAGIEKQFISFKYNVKTRFKPCLRLLISLEENNTIPG